MARDSPRPRDDDSLPRDRSILERIGAFIGSLVESDKHKIGGGTLAASMRLGLAEVRQAASLEGSVAQPVPYGMYGNITPGEVAEERREPRAETRATIHGKAAEGDARTNAVGVHGFSQPREYGVDDLAPTTSPATPGDVAHSTSDKSQTESQSHTHDEERKHGR